MNRIKSFMLSSVVLLGLSGPSQATDQFAQELPLRGTAEESANRAYDVLKAMEGTSIQPRGARGFFMGLPGGQIVIIGYRPE